MNIKSQNIFILGDIHAEWRKLQKIIDKTPENSTFLQLGDFGFDPRHNYAPVIPEKGFFGIWPPRLNLGNRKLLWIPGNHEDHDALPEGIEEVAPGIIYLPQGTIFSVNDKKVLAIGGADSVSWDRAHRAIGKTFFPEKEGVQRETINRILSTISPGEIPIFLSHAAPRQFSIPGIVWDAYEDSRNNLAELLSLVPSHWFFGHYHLSHEGATWGTNGETIHICRWRALNILELLDASSFF